jgi:hypothetical protein
MKNIYLFFYARKEDSIFWWSEGLAGAPTPCPMRRVRRDSLRET